jgi:glycine dehydrogenase
MRVIPVACDQNGNVDLVDLEARAAEHRDRLAAIMITYPSTHGVFEAGIQQICDIIHQYGGQVYIDGANMNALVGIASPGQFGGDVSHLNLHKTFCIPHGGGGPGVGPVAVAQHLAPFLPNAKASGYIRGSHGISAISATPYGSASILPISWMYITMMGGTGLTAATENAILAANYIAKKLAPYFPILYKGQNDLVAHECILDLRALKEATNISNEDVAKRLIDYGFHAPTMSFPVPGTLMVEPTESESLAELDRFIEAMIQIRQEIDQVQRGTLDAIDNPLKNAPHTAEQVTANEWHHTYTREQAAFPVHALRQQKYWPPVGRADNAYGDRNLFCNCPPLDALIQG